MREIKFRAWDKKEKEMIDNLISWNEKSEISHSNHFNSDNGIFRGYMWGSRNLEIMQYTGLKDKNGKEIYEGDIIKFIRNGGFENGEVFFEEGKFQVMNFYNQSQDNPCDAFAEQADLEIIGNIYENQELLVTD